MKKTSLLLLALCAFQLLTAQDAEFQWAVSFGGIEQDDIEDLVVDQSGNIYASGRFEGTVDFDPGPGIFELTAGGSIDSFILKLNAQGEFLWALQIDNSTTVAIRSIELDPASGDMYVSGNFQGSVDFDPGAGVAELTSEGDQDAYLLRLDANGSFEWVRHIRSIDGYTYLRLVNMDADGDLLLVGWFYGTVDFDPGPGDFLLEDTSLPSFYDGFICKLTNQGDFIWAKQLSGDLLIWPLHVSTDTSGGVYTSGVYLGDCDFDPGSGTNVINSVDNSSDGFIVKLDSDGNYEWAQTYGSEGNEYAEKAVIFSDDHVYITGGFTNTVDFNYGSGSTELTSNGDSDVYLVKLDTNGEFIWARQFGGAGLDGVGSLTVDTSNRIYLTGRFEETVDFDPNSGTFELTAFDDTDVFVCKLGPSGNLRWAKQIGGLNGEFPAGTNAISLGNNGDVLVAGKYFETCDFDPGAGMFELESNGLRDSFIVRLGQTLGVEDISEGLEIAIAPNPSSGEIRIDLGDSASGKLVIRNVLGQQISSLNFKNSRFLDYYLPSENGLYFIEIFLNEMSTPVITTVIKK